MLKGGIVMTPNKDRCLDNIYALAKKNGLRIRDLETACGVSVGYLARLRQDKKQSLPGSDFLFRVSILLETSMDNLMFFDYRLASDNEMKLSSFLSQLNQDTLGETLVWQADPDCFPSPYISDSVSSLPDHPLLALDPVLMQQGKSKEFYLSPFHPAVCNLVPQAAWRAPISDDTDALLTKVSPEPDKSEKPSFRAEVELYLYNKKTKALSPLCHTNQKSPGILDNNLLELCYSIEMMFKARPLDKSALSAIDQYMKSRSGR